MGEYGATCAHTLTAATRDIPKSQWDQERFGQICFGSESFADWKADIENLCSLSGRCTYQQQISATRFLNFINKVEKAKAKYERRN